MIRDRTHTLTKHTHMHIHGTFHENQHTSTFCDIWLGLCMQLVVIACEYEYSSSKIQKPTQLYTFHRPPTTHDDDLSV